MNNEAMTHAEPETRKADGPSPREFMRARHPDLFSDTEMDSTPALSKAVFEYHLETLTSRKEEYTFEHFCRKLAEHEICPNLRVQTGPTGGGDSKVDSETYPVAREVAERWWTGEPSGGSERWAFAFSAMKAWQKKVRADVANIVSTGRDYKRIYFFTNQFVSDRARAKVEDELKKGTGIPVHIVDRNWIVEKVYDHGHLGMAITALAISGAGEETKRRHGPRDTARLTELEELDAQISDPARYEGARFQLAEDSLSGALLARALERPRHEVEGRFAQAERLAKPLGISQQLMRIAYNRAWTAYWWYEDHGLFNQFYSEVESYLADSTEADDVGRLFNLWQLLITIESPEKLTKEAAQSERRRATLSTLLQHIADDRSRPNNALQARTSLALLRASDAVRRRCIAELDGIWTEISSIVEESTTMGQYPVDSLADLVRELGNFAEGAAFDELYEKVVALMQQRKSDGDAGTRYLERGVQKLSHDKPYEAIGWIGRAEALLVKEEYERDLIMALVAGSYAYESAGLLWAARNKILIAAERGLRLFERTGEMHAVTVRILRRLGWIELQLGRIPHVLQAMTWTAFAAAHAKLNEEQRATHTEEVELQEAVLGIHCLNLPLNLLQATEALPDALERLGLVNARLGLLFALGHEKRIFAEGYFPPETGKDELRKFFEAWQDQPASADIPQCATLLEGAKTTLRSIILGSEFVVVTPSKPTFLGVAESLLGAMEAFLATSDEADLFPHAERTTIVIRDGATTADGPSLSFKAGTDSDAEIVCPRDLVFSSAEALQGFATWLREAVIHIAGHRFMIRDVKEWLNRVGGEEAAFARSFLLGNVLTVARNVFGYEPHVRLADWIEPNDKIYECLRTEPWRVQPPPTKLASPSKEAPKFGTGAPPTTLLDVSARKHTERQVLSPIDIELWNKAGWCGTLFGSGEGQPPMLGLLFRDIGAGIAIFRAWRARWGKEDLHDALRVAVVTGLSALHPAHYAVSVGPNLTQRLNAEKDFFVAVSKNNRMTPDTTANLDRFLAEYRRYGAYFLMPGSMAASPRFETDCFLTKRHLQVRAAWEIGDNDPDMAMLEDDDEPLVPSTVSDPPVRQALERIRAFRRRPT
ncbi:hypothetical protein [Burkholderia cenocepacia]|uniref:hypothetical protein n=1 Tax=Burkholderia cenocepacia TaxID=95486 RepID=UPI0038430074